MYGKDIEKSSETPYVVWNIFDNKKTYDSRVINAMRAVGIEEAAIYSSYKTGRIFTENNKQFLTKDEKEELNFFYKEYKKLANKKIKNNKMNILQFVNFANSYMGELYYKTHTYLFSTLNDFLRRHLEKISRFLRL